jgi:hypothetical protein
LSSSYNRYQREKTRRQHGRSKLYGRDEVRYTITAFWPPFITFFNTQKYRQGALEGLDQKNTKKFLRQSTPQHPRQFEEQKPGCCWSITDCGEGTNRASPCETGTTSTRGRTSTKSRTTHPFGVYRCTRRLRDGRKPVYSANRNQYQRQKTCLRSARRFGHLGTCVTNPTRVGHNLNDFLS